MAIYLVTGAPGAGKTLNTIMAVHKRAQAEGRSVYYRGISLIRDNKHGIKFENWFEMPHPNDDGVDLKTDVTPWSWQNAPDGSIILIDEAQFFYPATSPTAKQPPYIMDMSTHRHRGFDIYLITQGTDLLNSAVKNWVQPHIHYRNLWGGLYKRAYINEQCINNIRSTREISREAIKKRIRHDKRWYDVYISASVHTKNKRVPKMLVILAMLPLILIGGGALGILYYYDKYASAAKPSAVPAEYLQSQRQGPLQTNTNGNIIDQFARSTLPVDTDFNPLVMYNPRVEAMPETAPAYDELRKPQTWPKPQCLINRVKDKCSCYTQQATIMQDYPDELCRTYATRGYFDPTKKDRELPPLERRTAREEQPEPIAPALPFAFVAQAPIAPTEPAINAMQATTAQP